MLKTEGNAHIVGRQVPNNSTDINFNEEIDPWKKNEVSIMDRAMCIQCGSNHSFQVVNYLINGDDLAGVEVPVRLAPEDLDVAATLGALGRLGLLRGGGGGGGFLSAHDHAAGSPAGRHGHGPALHAGGEEGGGGGARRHSGGRHHADEARSSGRHLCRRDQGNCGWICKQMATAITSGGDGGNDLRASLNPWLVVMEGGGHGRLICSQLHLRAPIGCAPDSTRASLPDRESFPSRSLCPPPFPSRELRLSPPREHAHVVHAFFTKVVLHEH